MKILRICLLAFLCIQVVRSVDSAKPVKPVKAELKKVTSVKNPPRRAEEEEAEEEGGEEEEAEEEEGDWDEGGEEEDHGDEGGEEEDWDEHDYEGEEGEEELEEGGSSPDEEVELPPYHYHKGGKTYHFIENHNPHVTFAIDTEEEHLAKFKKISGDLEAIEHYYLECIEEIDDHNYTEEEIEGCVGTDFLKLLLDIKYETYKIIAKADYRFRSFFVDFCYLPAGENEAWSKGCDLLEKDMLDMMWGCLDFIHLAEINREKYVKEYANMSLDTFDNIIGHLANFKKEFFELLDEIDSHKDITLMRLKNRIDERTKIIVANAERDEDAPKPKIHKYYISLEKKEEDPNFEAAEDLPHYEVEGKPEEEFEEELEKVHEEGEEEQEEQEEGEEGEEGEMIEEGHHEGEEEDNGEVIEEEGGDELEEEHGEEGQRRLTGIKTGDIKSPYRFLNYGRKYNGLNMNSRHLKLDKDDGLSINRSMRGWIRNMKSLKALQRIKNKNVHAKYGKKNRKK